MCQSDDRVHFQSTQILTRSVNNPSESEGEINGQNIDCMFEFQYWALIVAIDLYTTTSRLRGCVADAESFQKYLVMHLMVPPSNIATLHNENASRESILTHLYRLRDDPEVRSGDVIIIYYAGHGSRYDARECFTSVSGSVGFVDTICPPDRGSLIGGELVPDISLRELNIILAEIASKRWRRITFILDCCFSGGGAPLNAKEDPPSYENMVTRYCEPLEMALQRTLMAADSDARRLSPKKAYSEEWWADHTSHVMLSPCEGYRSTRESYDAVKKSYSGDFTRALLEVLLQHPNTKLTYIALVKLIATKMHNQIPVVSGSNKNALIWSGVDEDRARTSRNSMRRGNIENGGHGKVEELLGNNEARKSLLRQRIVEDGGRRLTTEKADTRTAKNPSRRRNSENRGHRTMEVLEAEQGIGKNSLRRRKSESNQMDKSGEGFTVESSLRQRKASGHSTEPDTVDGIAENPLKSQRPKVIGDPKAEDAADNGAAGNSFDPPMK